MRKKLGLSATDDDGSARGRDDGKEGSYQLSASGSEVTAGRQPRPWRSIWSATDRAPPLSVALVADVGAELPRLPRDTSAGGHDAGKALLR